MRARTSAAGPAPAPGGPARLSWILRRRSCALTPRSPKHSAAESWSLAANRHECRAGSTRTEAAGPQSTVSPPVTRRICSSPIPSRRSTRALSGEPTTTAPVERAMAAAP